jgi:hypothetical protein
MSRFVRCLGLSAICAVFLVGCATQKKPAPLAAPPAVPKPVVPKPAVRVVKSEDGRVEGTIVGTPAPGSKFAQVRIGMKMAQVERLIGPPKNKSSRVTGNEFHPFYSGGDTRRVEAFYENEGQLTFSNTSRESGPDTLIRIVVNPKANGGP